jgi:hypothetical protein
MVFLVFDARRISIRPSLSIENAGGEINLRNIFKNPI